MFELYKKHPSATSLAALKPLIFSILDLPEFHRFDSTLRLRASGFLDRYISRMLETTESILQIKKLYEKNINYFTPNQDPPFLSNSNDIPEATNDVISTACGCAMLFMSSADQDISGAINELRLRGWAWWLPTFHLEQVLSNCQEHIEKMKYEESYRNLIALFENPEPDNISALRHLIYLKDDDKFPLVRGSTQEQIQEGKHLCLYGGDDIEWIRKFTSKAKDVATIAGVALELVYIRKSNAKEIINTIENENVSKLWHEPTWCWYFWTRLEYMLYSRMQLAGKNNNVENDHILQGLKKILSFNVSLGDESQGWAIFSCGSSEIVTAKEEMIMQSFGRFELHWKQNANVKGFVAALKEDLQQLPTPEHCSRLILPHIEDDISEMPVFCPDCNCLMEVYTVVRCYSDD